MLSGFIIVSVLTMKLALFQEERTLYKRMVRKRCKLFFVILGLFLLSACVSVNQNGMTQSKGSEKEGLSQGDNASLTENDSTLVMTSKGEEGVAEARSGKEPIKSLTNDDPGTEAGVGKNDEGDMAVDSSASNDPGEEDTLASSEILSPTNQELIDSALEYCQVATDFWEQGDLDNALDALDKAYSLILKVTTDEDPEVLQQKEDIRFTVSKRIIEVYASRFTVVNGSHDAIPLETNRHVNRALELFKGREKRFFLESYRRSGKYRPDIVEELKAAGLPEELSWLPLIESGFKIRALSRARALGLWQFIASTGYKFGLKRDNWVDERMDPEKATKAAIAYLKELHQIFGDWTTVLAAYNCGEGTVLKRIRTQRINYLDNFWDLYEKLPRETAFYVPKFIAMLIILKDPEAHGFTLPPGDEMRPYEEITIHKQVHLKTISRRLEINYRTLYDINAELRYHVTPKRAYSLKVPVGKGEILLANIDSIPVYSPPVPEYVVYRVRRGDSLSVIAERHRTSVRAIMAVNGLKRADYVKVGWKLKIPTKRGYYTRSTRSYVQTVKFQGEIIEYRVRNGDSLWVIARRFRTTTKDIQALNNLTSSLLKVGQVIKVPNGHATAAKPSNTQVYRVQKGDSPYLIAKKHQINLSEFLKINNMTPRSTIFPGQKLHLKVN
jgi:membrane-bound lytic murein transglycosylase D